MCNEARSESGKLCGMTPCQAYLELEAKLHNLRARFMRLRERAIVHRITIRALDGSLEAVEYENCAAIKEIIRLEPIRDAARAVCASWEQYSHSTDPAMLPAIQSGMARLIGAVDMHDERGK